jgi:hypothetical protein
MRAAIFIDAVTDADRTSPPGPATTGGPPECGPIAAFQLTFRASGFRFDRNFRATTSSPLPTQFAQW